MEKNTLPFNKLTPSKSNTRAFIGIQMVVIIGVLFALFHMLEETQIYSKSEIKNQIKALYLVN